MTDNIEDLLARAEEAIDRGEYEPAMELAVEMADTLEPAMYLERAVLMRRLLQATDDRWSRWPTGHGLVLRNAVLPDEPAADDQVVIPTLLRIEDLPYHGYRFARRGSHSGWVLWAGDVEPGPAGSINARISTLVRCWPDIVPYLSLPAGWCFQLAPAHEEVWFDTDLLAKG